MSLKSISSKFRAIWQEETRDSVVANEVSNARDFCANERNFLTALRLSLVLVAVSAALLLKFRLVGNYVDGDETGVTTQSARAGGKRIAGSGEIAYSGMDGRLFSRGDRGIGDEEDQMQALLYLLGLSQPIPSFYGDTIPAPGLPSISNLQKQYSANNTSDSTPLLETNRVAIPLGVLTFILALLLLIVNTYSYASTNGQLRRGDAFAGHLRLSAAVNAILALLLLAAVISFLVVQRI